MSRQQEQEQEQEEFQSGIFYNETGHHEGGYMDTKCPYLDENGFPKTCESCNQWILNPYLHCHVDHGDNVPSYHHNGFAEVHCQPEPENGTVVICHRCGFPEQIGEFRIGVHIDDASTPCIRQGYMTESRYLEYFDEHGFPRMPVAEQQECGSASGGGEAVVAAIHLPKTILDCRMFFYHLTLNKCSVCGNRNSIIPLNKCNIQLFSKFGFEDGIRACEGPHFRMITEHFSKTPFLEDEIANLKFPPVRYCATERCNRLLMLGGDSVYCSDSCN